MRFRNRRHAGEVLAPLCEPLRAARPLVLGVPRGGVPIAAVIAAHLGAELNVILTRKLPIPFAPEVAFGVIGEDGVAWHDPHTVGRAGLTAEQIQAAEASSLATLQRYAGLVRAVKPAPDLEGRTVILVDDGVATGATLRGAVRLCRTRGATKVVVATPVASDNAAAMLERVADGWVCALVDPGFVGVGGYYDDFHQLDDEEMLAALR